MALVVVVVIIIIVVVVVIWGDGSTELEFKTMIQNLVTTDSCSWKITTPTERECVWTLS